MSNIYDIPSGSTASVILQAYMSAQNTYELERLKKLYERELSRDKRVEYEMILNAIDKVLEARK